MIELTTGQAGKITVSIDGQEFHLTPRSDVPVRDIRLLGKRHKAMSAAMTAGELDRAIDMMVESIMQVSDIPEAVLEELSMNNLATIMQAFAGGTDEGNG